ncbi:MAG: aldehyde dehydrogenase family protein [Rhizobium sp.]|nr:aldehyde dehydrogenase family protein [Rhizobium sp.]
MSDLTNRLVDEYFATGTLSGLPDRHFIDGVWLASASGDRMETFDPGLGRAFHSVVAGGQAEADAAVDAARRALKGPWGKTTPTSRGVLLMRVADLIRRNMDRLAVVESLDVGKPLQEAEGDIAGAIRCFDYYAGAADKIEGKSLPLGPDYVGITVNEPVGVTAHVVPWNYPFSTLARSLAPALAAGCTAVVKPAEQTPLTALMLADILQQAGIPDGVVNVVLGTGAGIGAPLVANPDVRHITFTGSVDTGIEVMRSAARNVASVVLELGGKSPAIVMADANLERAADDIAGAIFENAGQICSASARLVVERKVHDETVALLVSRAERLGMGHGLRRPNLGPVNSRQHLDRIGVHVEGGRSRGLTIATGSGATVDPVSNAGWFFQPTIFDDVPAADPIVQQEIFGPVLAVQVAEDAAHAVELANATQFGLVAGIYTKSLTLAHRMARDIDAGQVFINEYFAGGIMAPFGGVKKSGIGREKGLDAVRNYCKVKTITARIED